MLADLIDYDLNILPVAVVSPPPLTAIIFLNKASS